VLITHPWIGERGNEEELLLRLLRQRGVHRDRYAAPGASIHRFEFASPPSE
jgi:hypothetical protein